MLTVFTGNAERNCDGVSRRDFIRVGALSLGGLALPQLLAAKASANESYVKDKSVVMLYLSGGASHIETFDPKMSAPAEIRSVTGEVSTTLPGVTFGGTFPRLANHAKRMAVVRSFQHSVGSHEQAHVHVLTGGLDQTGRGQEGFSIGSLFTRMRGTNHPTTGMPTYALLTENEIDGQYRKELGRVKKGSHSGSLGPSFAPLNHTGDSNASMDRRRSKPEGLAANMNLNIPADRFGDRRLLLRKLDMLSRRMDATGMIRGTDRFNQQAVNLVMGGAADAFTMNSESPSLVDRYDTSHIRIGHKAFRPSTLGKQMLVARRLCEAGAGFVTVHSAGWDMHADNNNPGMVKGMEMLGRTVDKAVSTFLEDLHDRGLDKDILLVITGDFGRTPKVNRKGGRDHWARLGTLAFAGGGLEMGQVIGQSARGADVPGTEPVTPGNLLSTIMHTVFDVGKLRLDSGIPRELSQIIESRQPIQQLVT